MEKIKIFVDLDLRNLSYKEQEKIKSLIASKSLAKWGNTRLTSLCDIMCDLGFYSYQDEVQEFLKSFAQ